MEWLIELFNYRIDVNGWIIGIAICMAVVQIIFIFLIADSLFK